MYIIIDDCLFEEEYHTDDFKDCIRMLMLAYKEGLHIVSISPDIVKKILNADYFFGETKSLLNHYYVHQSRQVGMLLSYFGKVCIVKPRSFISFSYSDLNSKIEYICVKTIDLKNTINIQKTVLLAENIHDSKVLSCFGEYFLKENNIFSHILIQCEFTGGGGDTTSDIFQELHHSKTKFCLCVLDSDQRYPASNFGQTAKKVLHYLDLNKIHNFKCTPRILEGFLEIENLLPDSFYQEKYGEDVNKANLMDDLEKIPLPSRNHIDLKSGIYCKKIQKNDLFSQHWREVFGIINRIDCPVDHDGKNACNYKIINGYGSKILIDFIDYKQDVDIINDVKKSRADIKRVWSEVGKDVASFCCGHAPLIAV